MRKLSTLDSIPKWQDYFTNVENQYRFKHLEVDASFLKLAEEFQEEIDAYLLKDVDAEMQGFNASFKQNDADNQESYVKEIDAEIQHSNTNLNEINAHIQESLNFTEIDAAKQGIDVNLADKVSLWPYGDLTLLKCDAIVNAANEGLRAGHGICGQIFAAAGRKNLVKECRVFKGCKTGGACITPGIIIILISFNHRVSQY